MDCIVCFDTLTINTAYKCCNQHCGAVICGECLELLIKYSCESNVLPICPDVKCKSYYLFTEIKKLHRNTYKPDSSVPVNPLTLDIAINLYARACLQSIIKEKGDTASKVLQQQKIIEKMTR